MFLRLFFKALLLLAVVLGGLAYVAYLQGRDPMQTLSLPFSVGGSAEVSKAQQSAGWLRGDGSLDTLGSTSTVYRWRDADGNLHFSDKPPQGRAQVDSLELDPDANLIPGLGPVSEPAEPSPTAPSPAAQASFSGAYSPDRVRKLFEQAEQVKQQLNQRHLDQERLREELYSR